VGHACATANRCCRRDHKIIAQGYRKELLHQSSACSASPRCLGDAAHSTKISRPCGNCILNLTFTNAVAPTDFRITR
jgi:hypothetical protein